VRHHSVQPRRRSTPRSTNSTKIRLL
jgi:hypothetical protein